MKIRLTAKLRSAAQLWIDRRDRAIHPGGYFDRAHRFFPSEDERRECCDHIRSPSRAYPYSYMTHCRSAEHVGNLTGYDARTIRAAARRIEQGG